MIYDETKIKVGIYLEPKVLANCDLYAEYFSESRSNFLNEALKLYVRHLEKHCESISDKVIKNTESIIE